MPKCRNCASLHPLENFGLAEELQPVKARGCDPGKNFFIARDVLWEAGVGCFDVQSDQSACLHTGGKSAQGLCGPWQMLEHIKSRHDIKSTFGQFFAIEIDESGLQPSDFEAPGRIVLQRLGNICQRNVHTVEGEKEPNRSDAGAEIEDLGESTHSCHIHQSFQCGSMRIL